MEVLLNPSEALFKNESSGIFHKPEFHKINYKLPEYRFHFQDKEKSNVLFFHAEKETLVSTARSSFGGFSFYAENQAEMLKEARSYLNTNKPIKLIFPPLAYGFTDENLVEAAISVQKEMSQVVHLQDWDLEALSNDRKKNYRQAVNKGFQFKKIDGFSAAAYTLIKNNRTRKKYPMTMSLEQLQRVAEAFPEFYTFYKVIDREGEMLSAAVVIKINAGIAYLFYIGSAPNRLSSDTFLLVELMKTLQNEHFKLFDFGVSSVNGIINPGLFRFKEGFGSSSSDKLTLIC